MTTIHKFKINYSLPRELCGDLDTLAHRVFKSAKEDLLHLRSLVVSDKTPLTTNDDYYLKASRETEAAMDAFESTAELKVSNTSTVVFSFEVLNDSDLYAEVSESGRRLWLRQHIDDNFHHYLLPGLLRKTFKIDFSTNVANSPEDIDSYTALMYAFERALDYSAQQPGGLFWIDGENLVDYSTTPPDDSI